MTARAARAAELEKSVPAAAEMLRFYRQIVEFQASDSHQRVDRLLQLTIRHAPAALAQAADALLRDPAQWDSLLHPDQPDPARAFIAAVLLQPEQEQQARRATKPAAGTQLTCLCPFCGEPPLLAILRPEGDGGKRSLLCGRCFTEWEFRRLLCPNCGEENQQKLAVYTAEEFPHIRVEACDTCRAYLKSIDLTRNGLAVPEVDELASLSLDLWAAAQGYHRIQPNLFGA